MMQFSKDQKVFVASDWHFDHKNIIKYDNRPYSSVEEMNEDLIKIINDTVGEDDILFFLGDLTFSREPGRTQKILEQINCKNFYWILGNHDNTFELWMVWVQMDTYKEIQIDNQKFVLCHYPIENWNGRHKGWIHIHGHCHQKLDGIYGAQSIENRYDVSHHHELCPKPLLLNSLINNNE